ncbi:hypothetical protein N6H14_01250 [Paenibacillus sp. CC-CFT747]|nr:hypothetical protein N6H14_01250 [Paenibacillus sp. CC-CFT747]
MAAQFLFDYVNASFYESDALSKDLQVRLLGVNKGLAAEMFGQDALRESISQEIVEEEKRRLEEGEGLDIRGREDLYRLLKERGI